MIAAIYARKSTEQTGVCDDNKSVTRQIVNARAYALKKGWTVSDAHVFVDDGISGAEFNEHRPGLDRLMKGLTPRALFQVLIVSELSRLAREQFGLAPILKALDCAGVTVHRYLDGKATLLDTPEDKMMINMHGYGDEKHRVDTSKRVHDTMTRKVHAAQVTGGRCFGYVNANVYAPTPDMHGRLIRLYVERRINEPEADVVRKIFRLYIDGQGFGTIAKQLNAEGAPCPRPKPGRPIGWAPSSVRQVMIRPIYKGEILWNQTKKRDKWGQRRQRLRPEEEWIRIPAKQLEIVSPDLWQEAQARWKNVRELYLRATDGRLHGRPTNGHESPYLLTGFTACKTCTGSLCVQSERRRVQRVFYYACTTHCRRGSAACAEIMLAPMEALDRAILTTIEQNVLQPAIITKGIEKALQQLRPQDDDDPAERRKLLQKDLAKIEAALDRLAHAVAEGGKLSTLLSEIRKREDQRTRLRTELAMLDSLTMTPFDPVAVEHELGSYLADWPSLAQAHPAQTRQILRKLLPNRIRVWREVRGSEKAYHFQGEAAVGKLFNGLVNIERFGVPNGI